MNRAAPQPAARARFWSFVIPWDAGTLAPNRVTHRMQRYRLAMHARRAAAFVWIQRGRPETATAIVDAPPTGRDRARIIATRPDGSSFSRWVDPADLYPIHQEGP